MTARKNTASSTTLQELEMLKAKIKELEDKMGTTVPDEKPQPETSSKIPLDDYIPVMSLIPDNLNLATERLGQGVIKQFTRFGEVKQILYQDLVKIMEATPGFVESGYFYIMDARVIRQHGLNEIYSKILTKEKIEKILDGRSDECVALFDSANHEQQLVIIDMLVSKIVANPESVNFNVVDKISRKAKINISQKAEDIRESMGNQ